MSGHTPGPWTLIEDYNIYSALGADSGDGIPADGTDGWHIASIGETPTFVDGEEVDLGRNVKQANGRLIAAAPCLLEALELCLAELEAEHMPSDEVATAIVKARAAIAKAKGIAKASQAEP